MLEDSASVMVFVLMCHFAYAVASRQMFCTGRGFLLRRKGPRNISRDHFALML